ncbi:hypothetical protein GOV05_01645 [Candidatus Woesearchaeota archaeon]|nr:hypothetical protein [Candidatus Woesearchaeota archaeon]
MHKKLFLYAVTLLILSSFIVLGENLETYEYIKVDDKILVRQGLFFDEPTSFFFNFSMPSDAKSVSLSVDGVYVDLNNTEYYQVRESSHILLEYSTSLYSDDSSVFFSILSLYKSDTLSIRVILDEEDNLRYKAIPGEIITSVYPAYYMVLSDGKSIIITWIKENVKEGEEFSAYILLEEKKEGINNAFLILLALLLLLVITRAYYSYKNQRIESQKKVSSKKSPAKKKKLEILDYLKEDEKQVVNILKKKKGSAEQGTIRTVGGFSKSTLSRILKELENRNIIVKEKKGKKNIVRLRTK